MTVATAVNRRVDRRSATPGRIRPLLVIALGGNALLRRAEPADVETQRRNVSVAVRSIAELARDNDVVITHGNGPQVGLLARQAAEDASVRPYPLDVLGAESEGMIGYLLEEGLRTALPDRQIATMLTQVEVDPQDPAFGRPTKPIGPVYAEAEARRLAAVNGWSMGADGPYVRRLVASPHPLRIVELATIETLVEAGVIVICVGGGGIPVARRPDGRRYGVEAVIDKDLSASLLARLLGADVLLMLTDVRAVERAWAGPSARPIRRAHAAELDPQAFASGSMRPKIEAARRFVEATGGRAAIGALGEAAAILAGAAGTVIEP